MVQKNSSPIVRFTVVPEINTEIVLTVAANVVCTLSQQNVTDPNASMLLFSDQSGKVRMYVNPSAASDEIAILTLQYEYNGNTVQVIIELRSQYQPTAEMPFPDNEGNITTGQAATIRPALTPHEITNMSNEDLLEKGYPMRPDLTDTPEAYQLWLTVVSQSTTIAPPTYVTNPYVSANTVAQNSGNWTGFELADTDPGQYNWATGTWPVPLITARVGNVDYSAIWVGIDDGQNYYPPGGGPASPGDLVQVGTGQNCVSISVGMMFTLSVYSYFAWCEYLPTDATQRILTGIRIHPGDEVYVQVWVGNIVPSRLPNLNGLYCFFQIENITTATTVIVPGTPLVRHILGLSAEWITERPYVSGVSASLAKFNPFKLRGACALNARTNRFVNYRGDPGFQYTMVNGVITLARVAPYRGAESEMEFKWNAYS